jgi:hypothetical protein
VARHLPEWIEGAGACGAFHRIARSGRMDERKFRVLKICRRIKKSRMAATD